MKVLEEAVIPYNTGKSFIVKKGQRVRISAESIVDCVVFNRDNLRERFDQARTKVHNVKVFISTGDKLYSKYANPMMTIVEDTYKGHHDLQYGMCSKLVFDRFYEPAKRGELVVTDGKKVENREDLPDHGCWENLQDALKDYDIAPENIPSPFNLFQNTKIVVPDGKLKHAQEEARPEPGKPAHVDLRTEMDCLVGLSACPECYSEFARGKTVRVQVFDE